MQLIDAREIEESVDRMARDILQAEETGESGLVLIGIRERGIPLARRLARRIGVITGRQPPVGELDVTLHRDDLAGAAGRKPVRETKIPFGIDGVSVVLVDDVVCSGRTARAALDAITAFGRPARVRLAALIDRGHRELPIRPDIVGREVETRSDQQIRVHLTEVDGVDEVVLEEAS